MMHVIFISDQSAKDGGENAPKKPLKGTLFCTQMHQNGRGQAEKKSGVSSIGDRDRTMPVTKGDELASPEHRV
jgi:hypothetical protein